MLEILEQVASAYERFGYKRRWWRGHANAAWQLTPSIYHRGLAASERGMFTRFMQLAPVVEPALASEMPLSSWLFVMQHHGLPTRLLDWTESPLVALFFAVSDSSCMADNGMLWSFEPSHWNLVEFGKETLLGPGTPEVLPILNGIVHPRREDEAQRKIAAILASRTDPRHAAQHAQCTIHGRDQALEEGCCKSLTSIVIPSERKRRISEWLEMLQINRQTLFPDLDNLARYVSDTALSGAEQ